MYTENELVHSFEFISNESYYVSDIYPKYDPDTKIEWIYLDWNSLKKTHYRDSACGIAYRYYDTALNWRSHWATFGIDVIDDIADKTQYQRMIYKCQCYEDQHNITLD